jgi:hypothetical protein
LNINELGIWGHAAFTRIGLTDISHAHFKWKSHIPLLTLQCSSERPTRFAVMNWRHYLPPVNWLPGYWDNSNLDADVFRFRRNLTEARWCQSSWWTRNSYKRVSWGSANHDNGRTHPRWQNSGTLN